MPITPTQKLIDLLKNDKVIPVIGAGVSNATAGLPGWGGLLQHGIEYATIRHLDENLISNATQALQQKDLLETSTHLKAVLQAPGYLYTNWLNEVFDDLEIISKALINSILDLSTPILCTTNYDTLLSEVNNLTNRQRYDQTEYQEIIKAIRNNNDLVIHLHGVYDKPDTVVLSKEDYDNLTDQVGYKELLKKLLSDYHFLFIGCSKDGVMDEDFSQLFDFIKTWFPHTAHQHYMLVHEKEINTKNHITLLTEGNIEAISFGDDYKKLPQFITSINPNLKKRQEALETFKIQIEREVRRIATTEASRDQHATKALEKILTDNFTSEYDWVDSAKMRAFEQILENVNASIDEKRDKLIFSQNMIQSMFNTHELSEKVALWNKNRSNPKKLKPAEFINTGIFAFQSLHRIPKDVLEDIKFSRPNVIHGYFYDGYLGGFIQRIENTKKRKLDPAEFYKNDEYLFENLKRIIDSLNEFLKLDPDDLYEPLGKATITKKLPDSFLLCKSAEEVLLRSHEDYHKMYARLPISKNDKIIKVAALKYEEAIYIIGCSKRHCFFWKPQEHISSKRFYTLKTGEALRDIFCYVEGSVLHIDVFSQSHVIHFENFIETSKIRVDMPWQKPIAYNHGFLLLKRFDSTYKGLFLKWLHNDGTMTQLLTIDDVDALLDQDTKVGDDINAYKDYREEIGLEREPYINIINSFDATVLQYKGKEYILLGANMKLVKSTTVLFLCEIDAGAIQVLDTLYLTSGSGFSYNYYVNNDTIKVCCGYLDVNRSDVIAEIIEIKNLKFVKNHSIEIPKIESGVRDIFQVFFLDEKTILMNQENEKLITYTSRSLVNRYSELELSQYINSIAYVSF